MTVLKLLPPLTLPLPGPFSSCFKCPGIPRSSLAHGRNSSGLWPMKETTGKHSFPPYVTRCHGLKDQGWGITADTRSLKTFKYFSCLIKEVDCCIKQLEWIVVVFYILPSPTQPCPISLYIFKFDVILIVDQSQVPWATKAGLVQRDSHIPLHTYRDTYAYPYP